ncbi:MAG: ATP-binding cassette domain-containing protein [Nocardioides sp.]
MIEVENLVKRFGATIAVDRMSFVVRPGVVTGFLGPNGAGKSTTMRAIVGLDSPTEGTTRVNGISYRHSPAPLAEVGVLLDGKAFEKSRSARNHLRAVGATVGVGSRRIDEVLETVGLAEVAHKPAGSFSLGMGQRLGIATALLADPAVVMLDEPTNGLDPDGIAWIRQLARQLADEGRTVLISSHLMSEMELTADHLIIVGSGRVIADENMASLLARTSGGSVLVASPQAPVLAEELAGPGVAIEAAGAGRLRITGLSASDIGEAAAAGSLVLHELTPSRLTLEEVFMELTGQATEFAAHIERARDARTGHSAA